MRHALSLALLIGFAIAGCAQDSAFSSNVNYPPLPKQAQIEGNVIVVLSMGPDGMVHVNPTGHPLLLAGTRTDSAQWNEWAAMGIERVIHTFKINQQRQTLPPGGTREMKIAGKTLHITITVDAPMFNPEASYSVA
jgi:hypothetical protein